MALIEEGCYFLKKDTPCLRTFGCLYPSFPSLFNRASNIRFVFFCFFFFIILESNQSKITFPGFNLLFPATLNYWDRTQEAGDRRVEYTGYSGRVHPTYHQGLFCSSFNVVVWWRLKIENILNIKNARNLRLRVVILGDKWEKSMVQTAAAVTTDLFTWKIWIIYLMSIKMAEEIQIQIQIQVEKWVRLNEI